MLLWAKMGYLLATYEQFMYYKCKIYVGIEVF